MKLIIDIETIPDQTPGALNAIEETIQVKAPDLNKGQLIDALGLGSDGKYKTIPELKVMWLEAFGDSAKKEQSMQSWLKTALNGNSGQICCIAIDSPNGQTKWSLIHEDESTLLSLFWDYINKFCEKRAGPFFIAHNAKFDLPFIFKRSVINGVMTNKYWKAHGRHGADHYCTMEAWEGFNGRISLDNLSKALSLKGKDGMTVADVWPEYEAGNLDKIKEYCEADVELTRQIYNKLNFL